MKNLLILIVAIAVFLHFYPQPELDKWFEQQKSIVLTKFSEATSTQVQLSPERVAKDIAKHFNTFRESERNHTHSITSSRSSIKQYYKEYCSQSVKRDQKLHQENQKKVCQSINKYTKYF